MQARYYDPVIGHFYSNDPVGFTNIHTFNRYAYANNNPYKYIDPDGMEVRAVYNNATGKLSMRDRDTKERIVINAESGGKPFGAPIEPGVYDILYTPRDGFYRLEPLDATYGDDTHGATGRDLFRLHKPGLTIGCIAADNEEGWSSAEGMLEQTKTSEVTVDSKSRNPFSEKTESSTRFGQLKVVRVSGRIESQKLKEQDD
ncbi:RHS repeat-associated core domain-containing protein [Pseudoalteromonas sp. NEC-BIFX-2020_015]|uniref:RHS repeat-associated core domain-containing protein n=1 Tax=Pseudoalteromonas sp. NEC-BIFX-2020_015 TaxID=2729544 RepID=UPI002010CCDE|nr:RHS repeat-associated core domain-containing protein [Pseudoalteromonas sp. NEC-BIFX-2020_015]